MKSTKRIFTIFGSVIVLSLLVIANVWAFGVGNVDGVWGEIEDGGGAYCDGWASAGVPGFSASLPSIQSSGGNITDENRVAYGDPTTDGASGCPTNWNGFQLQSGFGFNGIDQSVSIEMDEPFYLGSFAHYNNPIYITDNNLLEWVDLEVTVPIDCDDNGTPETTFSFSPRFYLDETTNDSSCEYLPGDPVNDNGCADAVDIVQQTATSFVCPSGNYTVNILGFTTNANCETIFDETAVSTQFITQERSQNNACLWAVIDRPNADAAVTKSCVVDDGATDYYLVTVTNAGPGTALGAHIVDTLPSGVNVTSVISTRTVSNTTAPAGTCTTTGTTTKTVTCDLNAALPDKNVDSSAKWEIKIYTTNPSAAVANQVVLTTTSNDTNMLNNTAAAACTLPVDLSVVKEDGDYEDPPYPSVANPYFDYTITVTNAGPETAYNVTIVDTLDPYTSFDTTVYPVKIDNVLSPSACTYNDDTSVPGGGTLTCNLGDMADDQEIVINFGVKIETGVPTTGMLEIGDACSTDTAVGDICNAVTVYTSSNETNTANNTAYEPKDVGLPTAVELAWFDVTKAGTSGITLGWETVNESDILGFKVYRSGKPGTLNKLLTAVSTETIGDMSGAVYSYKDKAVKPFKTYYYWLEVQSLSGTTELFGPISARLRR